MGKMNLLRASYQGKVGETVGQKWKGQTNICSYNKHSDAKSPAQIAQRLRHKLTIQILSYFYNQKPHLFETYDPRLTKFQHLQRANSSFVSKDSMSFSELKSLKKHVRYGTPARIEHTDFPPILTIQYDGRASAIEKSRDIILLARNTDTDYYRIVNTNTYRFDFVGNATNQNIQLAVWVIQELFQEIDGKNILEIHYGQLTGYYKMDIDALAPFGT